MRLDITDKRMMYQMLSSGLLGNTTKQWFDVDEWELRSPDLQFWGIRSLKPGGFCRLFCPRSEVRSTVESNFNRGDYNISCMIDLATNVTLWAEVYDSDSGLIVYGIEYPEKWSSWREEMPVNGKHWEGLAAKLLLRKHLCPNSLDDLYALMEKFPGHVYEMSVCEDCVGSMKDRNAIMWEARKY